MVGSRNSSFETLFSAAFPDLAHLFGLTDTFKYTPIGERLSVFETALPDSSDRKYDDIDSKASAAFGDSIRALLNYPSLLIPFDGAVEGVFQSRVAGQNWDQIGHESAFRRELNWWMEREDDDCWQTGSLLSKRFVTRCRETADAWDIPEPDLSSFSGIARPTPDRYQSCLSEAYKIHQSLAALTEETRLILKHWSSEFDKYAYELATLYGVNGDPLEVYEAMQRRTALTLTSARVNKLTAALSRLAKYPWNTDRAQIPKVGKMGQNRQALATEGEILLWNLAEGEPSFDIFISDDVFSESRWTVLNVVSHELAHVVHAWRTSRLNGIKTIRRCITPFLLPAVEGYAVTKETEVCKRLVHELFSELTPPGEAVLNCLEVTDANQRYAIELQLETAYWRLIRAIRGYVDLKVWGHNERPMAVLDDVSNLCSLRNEHLREYIGPFLDRPGEGLAYTVGPKEFETGKRRWRESGHDPAAFDKSVLDLGFVPFDVFTEKIAALNGRSS